MRYTGCDSGITGARLRGTLPQVTHANIDAQTKGRLSRLRHEARIDGLPRKFVPQVTYEGRVQVIFGNKLTPAQVKNPPVSLYWKADPCEFYLLCMTGTYPASPFEVLRPLFYW